VCSGVQYLHSLNIAHGNLKGENILINSEERACLTSFGLMSVGGDQEMANDSTKGSHPPGTYRWMAPELILDPTSMRITKESDIFAIAMVSIELFSGRIPFHEVSENAVPPRIIQGKRPDRPAHGVSNNTWDLIQQCWQADPISRPTISMVLDRLGLQEL